MNDCKSDYLQTGWTWTNEKFARKFGLKTSV